MDKSRKRIILIIALSIVCIVIICGAIYQYVFTENKLFIMIGGLIAAIIGKILVNEQLKYKGEYYRFKTGKNKILGNPNARELKTDFILSEPMIFQDRYNAALSLIGNLLIILTGIIISFLFWKFDYDLVYYLVPIIMFLYGLMTIFKNRNRKNNETRLILSNAGIWTEKLGNTSWVSIKEVNMILFYTGIRNREERVNLEFVRYDNQKDLIPLYNLGLDKYKMRKKIKHYAQHAL